MLSFFAGISMKPTFVSSLAKPLQTQDARSMAMQKNLTFNSQTLNLSFSSVGILPQVRGGIDNGFGESFMEPAHLFSQDWIHWTIVLVPKYVYLLWSCPAYSPWKGILSYWAPKAQSYQWSAWEALEEYIAPEQVIL